MQDNYKKLFGYINLAEPPKGLAEKIAARITFEQKRASRFQFLVSSISTFISLAIMALTAYYINNSFSQSGFYQYFSLLFSGDSAVYIYWKELATALIESAPLVGLIAFLSAVVLFVWSSTNLFKRNGEMFNLKFS